MEGQARHRPGRDRRPGDRLARPDRSPRRRRPLPARTTASLALAAQTTLLAARRPLPPARAGRDPAPSRSSRAAEQAQATARSQADAEQRIVGASAADLYRRPPPGRFPCWRSTSATPPATADVLHDAGARRARRPRPRGRRRARPAGQTPPPRPPPDRVADAQAAVAAADRGGRRRARRRPAPRSHGLSTAVTAQLAALGTSAGAARSRPPTSRRVQPLAGLPRLARRGRHHPAAGRPARRPRAPARRALRRRRTPTAARCRASPGPSSAAKPVTVLPAETVAAVSSALAQLGKPYVPGATGPDAYDCGGLTSASWLIAGYALPVTAADQWRPARPVAGADLQIGDLVLDDGGLDVGHLPRRRRRRSAPRRPPTASASAPYAPGSPAVRVTLAPRRTANARADPQCPAWAPCGAPLPVPGPVSPAWGGYTNGRIPGSALCPLGVGPHVLRCDAAAGLPGDVRGVPSRVRHAAVHHRLLPVLRRPARRPTTASRRWPPWPGTSEPRLGARGRPVRRRQRRRHAAVDVDERQRRPVRLRAPGLGAAPARRSPSRGTGSSATSPDRRRAGLRASAASAQLVARPARPGPRSSDRPAGRRRPGWRRPPAGTASRRRACPGGRSPAAVTARQQPLRCGEHRAWPARRPAVRPQRHRALDPQVQRRRAAARPAAAERAACDGQRRAGPPTASTRSPAPPRRTRPASRWRCGRGRSSRGRRRRAGRGGVGDRPVGHPGGERVGDALRRRRHPGAGHVLGEVAQPHPDPALALLEDEHRAAGRAVQHGDPQTGAGQPGRTASATSRSVGSGRSRRAQPLQQPRARPAERRVGHAAPPPGQRGAPPAGRGRSVTLASSAALRRTGSDVGAPSRWPAGPARRRPATPRRGRWRRAARSATSSRWMAATGCTAAAASAPRTTAASAARSRRGQPVRHQDLGRRSRWERVTAAPAGRRRAGPGAGGRSGSRWRYRQGPWIEPSHFDPDRGPGRNRGSRRRPCRAVRRSSVARQSESSASRSLSAFSTRSA